MQVEDGRNQRVFELVELVVHRGFPTQSGKKVKSSLILRQTYVHHNTTSQ